MSPHDAAGVLKALKSDLHEAVDGAVKRSLDKGLAEAKRRSSGPLTAADRRRADYPYARRHGAQGKTSAMPGGDPSIINVISGQFLSGWRVERGARPQGSIAGGQLVNRDEVAEFLTGGTKFMIARPIDVEMERRLGEIAQGEIEEAVAQVSRKYG